MFVYVCLFACLHVWRGGWKAGRIVTDGMMMMDG